MQDDAHKADFSGAETEVLLLISTHCAHCAAVLQIVTAMVKQGSIARLSIINLEQSPEVAQQMGVRSVPRLQIGSLVFEGELTQQEITQWLSLAGSKEGERRYLENLLIEGQVNQAIDYIKKQPDAIKTVAEFMLDAEAKINLKLGVGVIFEEFASGSEQSLTSVMDRVIPQLLEYVKHTDARIRSDACHYLSLTRRREFLPVFKQCLQDENPDVREIAQESLDELGKL